ncbi:MAG: integrase arm-type DNA-binding domain-containing protein [Xanthobacteraceae bacterium]
MPTKRLTDQFVERVTQPGHGRIEYFDAAFPALSLRVSQHGHKSWSLFYRVNGNPKLRRYKLGIYPQVKPAKARLLATEALDLVRSGIDPGTLKKQAQQDTAPDIGSIDALVRDYLRQHIEKNCSPGTYRNAKRMLEVDVLRPWRGRSLDTISKRDAIALIDRIAERAPVHANRVLARLNAMFNWAVDKDRIAASPIASIRAPTKEKARDRWLNDQEIVWFWEACERLGYPFGPLFQTLLLTGQRLNETASMEWVEVDLDAKLWVIPRSKAKSDRAHEVQLSEPVMALLRSLPRLGPHVFTGRSGRGVTGFTSGKNRLGAAMAEVSDGATIEKFILHDLRRTATSGIARLGIAPHVVDRILNHSSGVIRGVAAIYNRFEYQEERRAALAAWASYVTGLPTRPPAGHVTPPARGR